MTTTDQLFPCPFCGNPNVDPHYALCGDGTQDPGCMECGGTAPSATWNRRSNILAQQKQSGLSKFVHSSPEERERIGERIGERATEQQNKLLTQWQQDGEEFLLIPKSQLEKLELARIALHEVIEPLRVNPEHTWTWMAICDQTQIIWEVANRRYEQQPQTDQAVPDGWKPVPIEPTREMWAAGGNAVCENALNIHHDKLVRKCWDAMLTASPAPTEPREKERSAFLGNINWQYRDHPNGTRDDFEIGMAYASTPNSSPGCEPLRQLTEDDVRRIVREELKDKLSQQFKNTHSPYDLSDAPGKKR